MVLVAACLAAPAPSIAKPAPTHCDATVGSLGAAQSRVRSAAPGKVVCLADGSYAKLSLGGRGKGAPVTLRPVDPGKATIDGATISGSGVTLESFQISDEVEVEEGASVGIEVRPDELLAGQVVKLPFVTR